VLEYAGQLTTFGHKVAVLRKDWNMPSAADQAEDNATRTERRNLGRLRKGLRTPESVYSRLILCVLAEMGGRWQVLHVLREWVNSSGRCSRTWITCSWLTTPTCPAGATQPSGRGTA
jgi:hypothetical protein